MPETGELIAVYVAGITGIWKGIPAGIALKAPPIYNGFLTGMGSVTSVLILYFAGDKFRNWFLSILDKNEWSEKKVNFFVLRINMAPGGLG